MMGMMRNISTKVVNRYKIIRELWKGVAVPRSTYGYEVCKTTVKELDRMERIQNTVARIALGANSYTAVEALRGEMSWSKYRDRIAKLKANYKGKLIWMGDDAWAGYIHRFRTRSSWCGELRRIDRRYHLENAYEEQSYRKEINRCIISKSQSEWESGLLTKSSLDLY
jgi:hypothetical protein